VTGAGSVERDGSLRLFCALRLPDAVLDDLVEWQRRELAGVDRVRVVPRANLHITLAFLGRRPAGDVPAIVGELRAAAGAAGPIEFLLRVRAYRETRSVGMLVLRDLHGTASALAGDLFERLERLGVYRREKRPWLPHVTFVRFDRPPRLAPDEPQLGRFSPSDAALYTSLLRPTGAQYEVVESVALGG
jgi:2'-5' RNA ligase